MRAAPPGWRFDPFADACLGKSLFEMSPEDWLVRDASGMEAPSGGETTEIDSTEGDSPTAESGGAQ